MNEKIGSKVTLLKCGNKGKCHVGFDTDPTLVEEEIQRGHT